MNIKNWYSDKRRFASGKSSLEVKFTEYNDTFTLSLLNVKDGKPDAELSHFGYNRFFRLPHGLRQGRYASFKTLKGSILKSSVRHDLTFEYLKADIKAGYKYYNKKSIIL